MGLDGSFKLQGDQDIGIRNAGLHLLKLALPPHAFHRHPWSTFLQLYSVLDEFPRHLVEVKTLATRTLVAQISNLQEVVQLMSFCLGSSCTSCLSDTLRAAACLSRASVRKSTIFFVSLVGHVIHLQVSRWWIRLAFVARNSAIDLS